MQHVSDLLFKSATELAGLVRSGELSATELTESALERINTLNGDLNAFVLIDDNALEQAKQISAGDERPFAGVPIAIKDIGPSLAGRRQSFGSNLLGEYTPMHDSNVVRRIKEAGFVIVGKTNTPEMGIVSTTEPRRFGATRNPWNLDRTPGGSSGGSAAAVAGGMIPIAHGNDGGGSIRIPAACCGLVGLKPSRNRVSQAPEIAESLLIQDLALTRTVTDTATILDVLAGYEQGDANWAPPPPEPFAQAAQRDPGKLRIALILDPPLEPNVSHECAEAVKETGLLLESLGHEVVGDVDAPWKMPNLMEVFTDLWCANIAMGVHFGALLGGHPEPTEELVEPLTWELYKRGRELGAINFIQTVLQLQLLARGVIAGLAEYDVVVTPTLAEEPLKIGEINTCSDQPWTDFLRTAQFTPYTAVCNLTGQPAISLPLHEHASGMPLGIHFIGRPADEITLLQLAAQLEVSTPWAQRRPSPIAAQ